MLTLTFNEDNLEAIEAGKPYIVKWDSSEPTELKNPMFANVTVSSASDSVETAAVTFRGFYSPQDIETADNTMLGLCCPTAGTKVGACRAVFKLNASNHIDLNTLTDVVVGKAEVTADADVNGDERVSIADVTTLIDRLATGVVIKSVDTGAVGLTLTTGSTTVR